MSSRSTFTLRPIAAALAAAAAALALAASAATAQAAPAVTLTHDPDLGTNPTVTVEGSEWGTSGFYLGQVAIVGQTVTAGSAKWVKPGAPGSPNQVELQSDGSFATTLNATDEVGTSPDEVDCGVAECFIATWPQHSNPTTASIFTKNRLYFAPGIEVAPAQGIAAAGQTIAVNGGGVEAALISGNGVNMAQIAIVSGEVKTGPARWIRASGTGANKLTPSGTFASDLTLKSTFSSGGETIDCGIVQCAIAFWPGHTNPTVDPPTGPGQGQLIASQNIAFAYSPVATVTPSTNLSETQLVSVSGSGYKPGNPGVYVSQVALVGGAIVTPPPGGGTTMQWVRPGAANPAETFNPDGSFATSVTVSRTFKDAKGTVVDCLAVQCSVITWRAHTNPTPGTLYTSTPLSFAQPAPVSPTPTVTPPSGKVNQQAQFKLGTKAKRLTFATVRCGSASCQFQKPKRVALKIGQSKTWLTVTGPLSTKAEKTAKFGVQISRKAAKLLAGKKGRVKFKIRARSDAGAQTIVVNKLLVGANNNRN